MKKEGKKKRKKKKRKKKEKVRSQLSLGVFLLCRFDDDLWNYHTSIRPGLSTPALPADNSVGVQLLSTNT